MSKKKLKLDGLGCANCAYKIEEALKKRGFVSASINFVTKELEIEGDVGKAKRVIKSVEPNIRVIENEKNDHDFAHQHDDEKNSKNMLFFIISSVALFVTGLVMSYYNFNSVSVIGIFATSYLLVGWKVLKNAFVNSIRGKLFDENFLMTVATLGAFAIKEYPEAVAVILFYMIGEFLQDSALNKSRRSIKALLDLKADYANLKVENKVVKVRPDELNIGDVIIVNPGEKIPVDGVTIEGNSNVDTSALTGESTPRVMMKGSKILSGMINLTSLLTVEVTRKLEESTISRILRLVQDATARKAKTERFITKFARYYTPVVVGLAAVVAVIPPLITGDPFSEWFYRALVLLVISCPCALVLSIPLGYFGGIGKSAKEGVLVKGSNFLDILSGAKVVAFDKTGTLTKGVFKITKTETRNGFTQKEIIKFAALAEVHSGHPIALAIKEAYGEEIEMAQIKDLQEIAGYGVRTTLKNNVEIMVGNDRLLHRFKIEHDTCHVARTVAHVVIDKKYAGYMVISDELKEDAYEAVKRLRELGIKKILMITGDSKDVAENIAKQLELDEFHAELMPEDKVRVIEELKEKMTPKDKMVFVGDGINDAPVIARADVGIAMGALGSDAAIETADVVIMDDRPSKLPMVIEIARKTQRIVWQNIVFALGVKVAFIGLGIIGVTTMWEAVFADVGVAIIALFNAMRILK